MRRQTFKAIEDILRDYPDYDRYISQREEAILHPDILYAEENIGGGRSSFIGRPTEMKGITLAEDRALMLLKFQRDKIEKVINESDPITNQIVREYYFTRPRTKTWAGVAKDIPMSESHCRRLRDGFFCRLSDELGFIR